MTDTVVVSADTQEDDIEEVVEEAVEDIEEVVEEAIDDIEEVVEEVVEDFEEEVMELKEWLTQNLALTTAEALKPVMERLEKLEALLILLPLAVEETTENQPEVVEILPPTTSLETQTETISSLPQDDEGALLNPEENLNTEVRRIVKI